MRFDVITLFPKMFDVISSEGIIARAINRGLIDLKLWQLRDFSDNKHRNIDDKPYGGGAGMVMQVKPIRNAINAIKQTQTQTKVIYLSPQGKTLTQNMVKELSKLDSITLLCGRYQGIDERLIQRDIDLEISLGDFILTGGELPAMALIDAISRQLPQVLGNENSKNETFSQHLLEPELYTRPEIIDEQQVPAILLSGHKVNIAKYQHEQSVKKTKIKRPDLYKYYEKNTH